MLCFRAAQTGKHLLRTQNVSEQNQKHFLCPQQMLLVPVKTGKQEQELQCYIAHTLLIFVRMA